MDTHSNRQFVQSLIHYPKRSHPHDQSCRNPPHIDFGSLTLIFQDGTSGLEVSDRSEGSMTNKSIEQLTFSPVDPNPNLIFVNTGYLLERWTDGQWKGVRHRVCESIKRPEGDTESESCVKPWERYSIAFFAAFDPDTIIQSQGKAVLNVGNYLTQKRALMYSE